MQTNTTKAKLKAGETVIGCFMRTPDPGLVEFLGYQGWDFLIFDGEHGVIDPAQCEHMVRAAELRGVTPIARVPANEPHLILRYLDTGAQGVHVPWINTGEATEAAIRAIKYHPRGIRGLGGVRATGYGQVMPYGEYIQKANAETLSIIHIETAEAVDNIEAILAVEDVDVVYIGPTDLSHSVGLAGQSNHPTVQKLLDRVVEATIKTDVALGMIVKNPEAAREWQTRGARYIVITLEGIVGPACRTFIEQSRP